MQFSERCIVTWSAMPWQAAVLWRCADLFPNGMIEQNDFRKLLSSLLCATVHQVKLLEGSQGLIHMMQAAGCLQEDGSAHVRQFVEHCYHLNDGDLPLEHNGWDLLLFSKLCNALELETEVGSHACIIHWKSWCSAHVWAWALSSLVHWDAWLSNSWVM